MKRRLWSLALVGAVALFAAGLAAWQHLPLWPTVLIAVGAIAANGWLATLEDDLPGGFNNPDGTRTPKYVLFVTWVVRALEVLLALLILGALWLYFFGAR
jgi:hypothetical protein